jgi:putative membrane protein
MAMAGTDQQAVEERSSQRETDQLADSSKFLPDLPKPSITLALVVPISFVLGMATYEWGPELGFEDQPWYLDMIAISLVVFAVPALVGALFSYAWLKQIGGHSYLYRSAMVALALLLVIGLILVLGYIVSLFVPDMVPLPEFYIFTVSSTTLFLHLFHFMTSTERWVLALPATLMQPVLAIAAIVFLYYPGRDWGSLGYAPLILAVVLIVTFIMVGHVAMIVGTRPMTRAYGIDGSSVFRAFLEHWVSGGEAGRREIEDFFRSFSEPSIIKSEFIAFRRKDGGPIATLLVPSLHPGPWGELGGSDLPRKLEITLAGDHGMVMTFHGASDHDLNPVDHQEIDKLAVRIKEGLDGLDGWNDKASPSVRVEDGTDALAQAFNGAVIAAQTSAPLPTDDVDRAVGYAIEQEMEKVGASPGAFIDCHNCLLPGAGHVPFGTPKARRIQERVTSATERVLDVQQNGFRVGVGHVPNEGEFMSMGPTGIQALVVEVGDQRTAWVLADGNNMERYLREKVLESLTGKVEEAEVLTTDNHIVNVSVGGFNPVGLKDDHELFVRRCGEAVDMALTSLEIATVAASRTEVHDVNVWGKGNAIRLTANLNAAVSTSKTALIGALGLAFVVGFFALYYVQL